MLATLRNASIDYALSGDGAATVLIMHGLGANHFVFMSIRRQLSPTLRVLTPTFRGHGQSSKHEPYDTGQLVADTIDLCDALRIENVIAVGASRASHVAVRLAAEHPDRVSGLMTIGGVTHLENATRKKLGFMVNALKTTGMAPVADWFSARSFSRVTMETTPALQAFYEAMMIMNEPETYAEVARAFLEDHDIRPWLGKVRCPTVIVVGAEDQVHDVRSQTSFTAAIPHAELRVIPDSGHDCSTDQPGAVVAAILELAVKARSWRGLA